MLPEEVVTPYGTYKVGDKYKPADGSDYFVEVMDVTTYKNVEDVVLKGPNGVCYRMDWFKLSYRYKVWNSL